ncbi:MAG: acetyl-CoA C-acetyltransferase [Planctomycetes bacterium]|nr:acetyl-CoA C-acetyltransferase [Planctomycetota bacterium]
MSAVIVSACRTPVGTFQGGLSALSAPTLGSLAVQEAVRRAGVDVGQVEECLMGNVLQAGLGQNPARQAARGAGLPDAIGSTTINKVCGSGLKSVMLAAQAIKAGDHACVVAGGMESMTRAPYLVPQARDGVRLGHGELIDSMVGDGLWDVYNDFHMGITAEMVADEHDVSREAQDAFAAESHRRAADAAKAGRFDDEKFTVNVPQRRGDDVPFTTDENIREGMTAESIAGMRPAFKKDGSVTAGNASSINDGAAALVVMSEEMAADLGKAPLARITAYATGGCAPEWVMMAPEHSIKKCAGMLGMEPSDFDLHEINEAFSAAALALTRTLSLDAEKVNVNGGAVALGHPIGASGARVLVTLLHAMQQQDAKTGMASLCLGGGNAVSLAVERV